MTVNDIISKIGSIEETVCQLTNLFDFDGVSKEQQALNDAIEYLGQYIDVLRKKKVSE